MSASAHGISFCHTWWQITCTCAQNASSQVSADPPQQARRSIQLLSEFLRLQGADMSPEAHAGKHWTTRLQYGTPLLLQADHKQRQAPMVTDSGREVHIWVQGCRWV